ncbi:MAG: hypothetical protein OEW00_11615 [candidate division Zixibacteria bacterium]|nr:hypothetical protein [candidate division Zixibacteria bacterium]
MDTVGYWNECAVLDLFLEVPCPPRRDTSEFYRFKAVKAISVAVSPDEFGLLYVSSTAPTNTIFESSELLQVREHVILSTRSRIYGTGNYFDEANWIWRERFNIPIELKVKEAHRGVLSGLLPPGHGIWKGGRFDIKHLSFESHTWRDGDPNSSPSGGKLSATYDIENDSLVIKEAIFDYSDLEGRALWKAQRSADSMYMKNPPVIFKGD